MAALMAANDLLLCQQQEHARHLAELRIALELSHTENDVTKECIFASPTRTGTRQILNAETRLALPYLKLNSQMQEMPVYIYNPSFFFTIYPQGGLAYRVSLLDNFYSARQQHCTAYQI